MGFKKEGLLKAAIALSTLCSSYLLIQQIKHQQPPPQVQPVKKALAHNSVEIVRHGSGPRLEEYDLATFNLLAKNLENEVIVDTSLTQIIVSTVDGFRAGVLGMQPGEHRIIQIDPRMETKHFNVIHKESPIVYEVELLSIKR